MSFSEPSLKKFIRVLFLAFSDIILINAASFGALFIRFEMDFEVLKASGFLSGYLTYAVIYTAAAVAVFSFMKLYSSLWAFAGSEEVLHIVAAVVIIAGLQVFVQYFGIILFPRSYPVINALLLAPSDSPTAAYAAFCTAIPSTVENGAP